MKYGILVVVMLVLLSNIFNDVQAGNVVAGCSGSVAASCSAPEAAAVGCSGKVASRVKLFNAPIRSKLSVIRANRAAARSLRASCGGVAVGCSGAVQASCSGT